MPTRRRHARLFAQVGLLALGNWAVFAILAIWASLEVLVLALALLAFGAGGTLGVLGVVVSLLAFAVIAVCSELASSDPLSTHRFLASGSLAIFLLLLCGLGGYAVRALFRRLDAKRKSASPGAPYKT
jgi:hypothetical protein